MANETQTLTPEQQAAQAVVATMQRIDEVLKKSGHPMYKDEEAAPSDSLEQQASDNLPPADGAPAAEPPMDGAPAGDGGGEPPVPPAAAPVEGAEGDDRAAMEAELGELSDDELGMLEQALHAEKEKRMSAQAPGGEGGGEGGAPMEMSMKAEFASLAKSMEKMAQAVESMAKSNEATAKEVAALKKSQPAAPAKPQAQPTRAAASGRATMPQVLAKTDGAVPAAGQPQPLTKSELIKWSEGSLRSKDKHPAMNTDMIATIVATPEDGIPALQREMRKAGINLPSA